jgi:hypothetical protein
MLHTHATAVKDETLLRANGFAREWSMRGSSVSMVRLELGTIMPMW